MHLKLVEAFSETLFVKEQRLRFNEDKPEKMKFGVDDKNLSDNFI